MSETTDGVDERLPIAPAMAAEIDYRLLVGEEAAKRITALEARAERAERALLKTWEEVAALRPKMARCKLCGEPGRYFQSFSHTPDCIIPSLERRYAIANTTPDAGT